MEEKPVTEPKARPYKPFGKLSDADKAIILPEVKRILEEEKARAAKLREALDEPREKNENAPKGETFPE